VKPTTVTTRNKPATRDSVFDLFHHLFIENPGVPVWWPGFCLGFDILASGVLAALLMSRSGFAHTLTSKN